jgi:hypothetical protein
MKRSEVNVFKHTYEYFPHNNWTNTSLANDVLCNNICYMTTNDSVRNAQLKCLSSLRISKCIRKHHINPKLFEVVV